MIALFVSKLYGMVCIDIWRPFIKGHDFYSGVMSAEAKRRQVIPGPGKPKDIGRSPLGAEVPFWVMAVRYGKAAHFEATRISMAEGVSKKTAEDSGSEARQAWGRDPGLLPHLWGGSAAPPQGPW